jgi:hypothetical protein
MMQAVTLPHCCAKSGGRIVIPLSAIENINGCRIWKSIEKSISHMTATRRENKHVK